MTKSWNTGFCLVTLCLLAGCQAKRVPPVKVPDPVGHVVDVNAYPWSTELAPDTHVEAITTLPPEAQREQVTTRGPLVAFVVKNPHLSTSEDQCEYAYFIVDGQGYRIEGLPLGHRPLSDLRIVTDQYLTFDRWAEPHFGTHYIVDLKAKRVVHACAFPDQFFIDQMNIPGSTTLPTKKP